MQLKPIELNEAFAASMPKSIREFLSGKGRGKRWLNELTNGKDIALDKANFVQYPIPKTNRDPIFKDESKIKFYVFNNDSVYITTVNDDWQYITHNGQFVYNKWLPAKALIENSKEIYYLDLNDPNNFNTEKKSERSKYNPVNDPNYRATGIDDPKLGHKRWEIRRGNLTIDKSGYVKDPSRLAKKMVDMGLYDPAKRTKELYKKIVAMKKDLMAALDEITLDRAGTDIADNIRWAMGSFSSSISRYNNMMSNLNDYQLQKENGYIDNKQYAKSCSSTINDNKERIESSLNEVERYISKFVGVAIDWDTEDEEEN